MFLISTLNTLCVKLCTARIRIVEECCAMNEADLCANEEERLDCCKRRREK